MFISYNLLLRKNYLISQREMVYTVLIVGLKEKDAGKTSLALALLAYLREKGFNACGFKPRAGNSVWYDYDVVHEALSQGRLYGKDAKLLKAASTSRSVADVANLIEEFINPVHRLWAEPPLIDPISQNPYFILDRVTLWFKEGVRNLVIGNEALPVEYRCDDALFVKLRAKASGIYHVRDLYTLNKLTEEYYDPAVELAYKRMVEQHGYMVIESYSDIALPWKGLKDLNAVIGVKPGQVSVYEPEKYMAAVQLSASTYSQEELATSRIVELVKPIKEVRVPPFMSEEIVQGLKKRIPLLLEL
jgi:predicted P-loop ATPase/GTPase